MTRPLFIPTAVFFVMCLPAIGQAPKNLSSLPSSAFEHVYRHVRHLQALDSAAAASGRSSNLGAYYRNLAGLTQQEADVVKAVSLSALAELDVLDSQAQTIILEWRAKGPSKLLAGQKAPEPPPQLTTLQMARKTVLIKYRNNLRQTLGQAAFARFEQALIESFKVGPNAPASTPTTGH